MKNIYRNILTRPEIVEDLTCIRKLDKQKIYKALVIIKKRPNTNRQNKDFSNS